MLNDASITHLHVYNPTIEPEKSAALRRTLLEEAVKDETPEQHLDNPELAPDPDSPQLPSGHEIPSAPSTPRRQGSAPATQAWGNVHFSPRIDVRVTSSPSMFLFFKFFSSI